MDSPGAQIATIEAGGSHRLHGKPGHRVAWHVFGQGRPLVLLHGGHGSWLHWARNIEALSAHWQLWIPDLPGYGASEVPAGPAMSDLIQALDDSLSQALGADTQVHLAGFSFGGLVAAHLAAARPSVRSLALLGPGGHGGLRRPRGELQRWDEAARSGDAAQLQAVMRHNLAMHMLHAPEAIDDLALHIHTQACLRTRFRSKHISRGGGLCQTLQAGGQPLLLIWGEHDITAEPAQAAAIVQAARPDARAAIVPDAGHWVAWEQPQAVHDLLLPWLDAQG